MLFSQSAKISLVVKKEEVETSPRVLSKKRLLAIESTQIKNLLCLNRYSLALINSLGFACTNHW
jgi:hypothetical protein